jgi:hypothetical protein
MTLLDSAYRALLRLCPQDMRAAHGDDMRATRPGAGTEEESP